MQVSTHRMRTALAAFVGTITAVAAISCTADRQSEIITHTDPVVFADADTLFPHLRFADGPFC